MFVFWVTACLLSRLLLVPGEFGASLDRFHWSACCHTGFIVNQKLAAAPDSKHGSKSAPLVRTYAAVYPSFAAQPLATRTAGQLARHPHSAACSPHAKLTAPSFAAAPVWRARASADAVPAGSSSAQCNMASQPVKATAASSPELGSNPVYQYATMGQQAAAGKSCCCMLKHCITPVIHWA